MAPSTGSKKLLRSRGYSSFYFIMCDCYKKEGETIDRLGASV